MNYVGVDLHKQTSWFYTVDQEGHKLDSRNPTNDVQCLKQYLSQIPRPFTLAVEATFNWYFFVDLAGLYADKVCLANSYALKAFAKQHKKTDKIDARLIATILQRGFLPTVAIADPQTRRWRELLRFRMKLVSDRSRVIFRLKNLLSALGLASRGNFTTYKQLEQIIETRLPDGYLRIINGYIDQIKYLTGKIYDLKKTIEEHASHDEQIRHLMAIPGLSFFSAALAKSEIIDIARFRSFNRLCAYAGLAPRVSISADTRHYGPLNKNRRKHLQWILLETVIHFGRGVPAKAKRFQEIQKRKGYVSANVALARDMLKMIYHVLKENRDFSMKFPIQSVAAAAL